MNIFASLKKTTVHLFFIYILSLLSFPLNSLSQVDTLSIEEVVVQSVKEDLDLSKSPLSSNVFTLPVIKNNMTSNIKSLSGFVPNLYIPDYGSKMTSSIYMRGVGSRIGDPAIGFYVDGVPIFNKNVFDSDFSDILRCEVLRGPQAVVYGRNNSAGLIKLRTISPDQFQGIRFSLQAGNGGYFKSSIGAYSKLSEKKFFSVNLAFQRQDGFYKNVYDDSYVNNLNDFSAKSKFIYLLSSVSRLENIFNYNSVNQGGYAYVLEDEELNPNGDVNYNDDCSYERHFISDALVYSREAKYKINNVLSFQYLDDVMSLDNDFTDQSFFKIRQHQREATIYDEFTLRSNHNIFGVSTFYKDNDMNSPVTFLEDGVQSLILDNINAGLQNILPGMSMIFDRSVLLNSNSFRTKTYGVSSFFQNEFSRGRFTFRSGLRLNYEYSSFDYDNSMKFNYRFNDEAVSDFKEVDSKLNGSEMSDYLTLLPKFSLLYNLDDVNNVYLSLSRGSKSGGFNSQMFSDLVKNKMMADLGVYMVGSDDYTVADIIKYKPEYSYNMEVGVHSVLFNKKLNFNSTIFYTEIRNQQMTFFPSSSSSGRMTGNMGRTTSKGIELSARYKFDSGVSMMAGYGYANAEDKEGMRVPYAPKHTFSLAGDYNLYNVLFLDKIHFHGSIKGAGPIWWNTENTIKDRVYAVGDASLGFSLGDMEISLWIKNIMDKRYHTFYFESMGKSFYSLSNPRRFGLTINLII